MKSCPVCGSKKIVNAYQPETKQYIYQCKKCGYLNKKKTPLSAQKEYGTKLSY